MKILSTIFLIAILIVSLTSCFNSRWTEEERKEFETKCNQTDTFNNVTFELGGFADNEFDSIMVKDYKDSILVDSFKIFVPPASDSIDRANKHRWASIERTMNIKHKYQFIIPGQKPYELTNMKMVMWAQYTNTSEGWGCIMADYTIDSERFEGVANPGFAKRNPR